MNRKANESNDILKLTEEDKNLFDKSGKQTIFSEYSEIPFDTLSQLKWFIWQMNPESRDFISTMIKEFQIHIKDGKIDLSEFSDFVLPQINKYDNIRLFEMLIQNRDKLFKMNSSLYPQFFENSMNRKIEKIEVKKIEGVSERRMKEIFECELKCLFSQIIGTEDVIFSSLLRIGSNMKHGYQLIKRVLNEQYKRTTQEHKEFEENLRGITLEISQIALEYKNNIETFYKIKKDDVSKQIEKIIEQYDLLLTNENDDNDVEKENKIDVNAYKYFVDEFEYQRKCLSKEIDFICMGKIQSQLHQEDKMITIREQEYFTTFETLMKKKLENAHKKYEVSIPFEKVVEMIEKIKSTTFEKWKKKVVMIEKTKENENKENNEKEEEKPKENEMKEENKKKEVAKKARRKGNPKLNRNQAKKETEEEVEPEIENEEIDEDDEENDLKRVENYMNRDEKNKIFKRKLFDDWKRLKEFKEFLVVENGEMKKEMVVLYEQQLDITKGKIEKEIEEVLETQMTEMKNTMYHHEKMIDNLNYIDIIKLYDSICDYDRTTIEAVKKDISIFEDEQTVIVKNKKYRLKKQILLIAKTWQNLFGVGTKENEKSKKSETNELNETNKQNEIEEKKDEDMDLEQLIQTLENDDKIMIRKKPKKLSLKRKIRISIDNNDFEKQEQKLKQYIRQYEEKQMEEQRKKEMEAATVGFLDIQKRDVEAEEEALKIIRENAFTFPLIVEPKNEKERQRTVVLSYSKSNKKPIKDDEIVRVMYKDIRFTYFHVTYDQLIFNRNDPLDVQILLYKIEEELEKLKTGKGTFGSFGKKKQKSNHNEMDDDEAVLNKYFHQIEPSFLAKQLFLFDYYNLKQMETENYGKSRNDELFVIYLRKIIAFKELIKHFLSPFNQEYQMKDKKQILNDLNFVITLAYQCYEKGDYNMAKIIHDLYVSFYPNFEKVKLKGDIKKNHEKLEVIFKIPKTQSEKSMLDEAYYKDYVNCFIPKIFYVTDEITKAILIENKKYEIQHHYELILQVMFGINMNRENPGFLEYDVEEPEELNKSPGLVPEVKKDNKPTRGKKYNTRRAKKPTDSSAILIDGIPMNMAPATPVVKKQPIQQSESIDMSHVVSIPINPQLNVEHISSPSDISNGPQ